MSHSLLNPASLHNPSAFGYSHTARVPAGAELIFISGQYASDTTGAVVSADFGVQVGRAFENLGSALRAHGLKLSHIVQLRSYIVNLDFDKLSVVGRHIGEIWGSQAPTQTLLGVSGLAMPEILFEVEAVAVHHHGTSTNEGQC